MKDKNQKLLDEALEREFSNLSNLASGTNEKTAAVEDLCNLYRLKVEEAKIEQTKIEKEKMFKHQSLDRWLNFGLGAGTTIGGWLFYTGWQRSQQKFELSGTVTNSMFRNLLSNMIPRLKK